MASRPARPCTFPGCPELADPGDGRCESHQAARPSAAQRGYGHHHRARFRKAVLARDPICVLCKAALATEADHWPLSRRQLEQQGLDPDDPDHGRGLCELCHKHETARNQPGGWAVR